MSIKETITQIFPFPEFRPYQYEAVKKCIEYFESGIEIIIVEGPTGFGKSPVNIALGLYFAPSYYTTPQKKLREQLGESFGPKGLAIDGFYDDIMVLKSRKDYICKHSNLNSEECIYRNLKNHTCSNDDLCTYWKQKKGIFKSKLGIITFSNLIVHSYLPDFYETSDGESIQLSFEKRNLLIVDECHGLEEQVASLHAGFKVSPFTFPEISNFRYKIWNDISQYLPNKKESEISDFQEFLENTPDIIEDYSKMSMYKPVFENKKFTDKLTNVINKIKFLLDEIKLKRKWVVNLEYLKERKMYIPFFKPIRINNFLKEHIWKYGNKILLTSATIPYRVNLRKWLDRLGLENRPAKFITIPMIFPKKNRPIYLTKLAGSLSFKNISKNWELCVKNTKEILQKYRGKKGVIHVSSYQMMWNLFDDLYEFSIFPHNTNEIGSNDVIQEWIKSGKEVLISPAIFEGVDLKDDLCRFQILFKIPFANLQDDRVKYLLIKEGDQEWYNNETLMKIVQAYGRAIRTETDYADFYIIDKDFLPFYSKVEFPKWFKEAIIK